MMVKVDLEAGLHVAQEKRPTTRRPDLCNGPCYIFQSDFVKTKRKGADASLNKEADLLLVFISMLSLCVDLWQRSDESGDS